MAYSSCFDNMTVRRAAAETRRLRLQAVAGSEFAIRRTGTANRLPNKTKAQSARNRKGLVSLWRKGDEPSKVLANLRRDFSIGREKIPLQISTCGIMASCARASLDGT